MSPLKDTNHLQNQPRSLNLSKWLSPKAIYPWRLIVDKTGKTVAEYSYDPWGRVLEATGSLAEINPLRYRGYYYDRVMQVFQQEEMVD